MTDTEHDETTTQVVDYPETEKNEDATVEDTVQESSPVAPLDPSVYPMRFGIYASVVMGILIAVAVVSAFSINDYLTVFVDSL